MSLLVSPAADLEITIRDRNSNATPSNPDPRECCLVQIYPTKISDGLLRICDQGLKIGREAKNDLVLNDASVSRFHAELTSSETGIVLRDLGSTNGTFVNDDEIDCVTLGDGDVVRMGGFIFKFLLTEGIEAQYHATVYSAMTRDGLTGAFNKSYLYDALNHEIAKHRRCQRALTVLLLDIDHFKRINDTYGHLIGDEVLREFSHRIAGTKRSDDLFCRYGGEEFVLILSETDSAGAVALAEKCRLAIASKPFATSDGDIPVTVSIGVAQLSLVGPNDAASILDAADMKLYQAKEEGRNRICA